MLLGPFHIYLESIAAAQRHSTSVAEEFSTLVSSPPYWRWFHHLWFLVPLLWMCSIAAALHAFSPALSRWRLPARIETALTSHFVVATLSLAVSIGLFRYATNWTLHYFHVHQQPVLTSVFYVSDLLQFLPFFAAGALLARSDKLLDRFAQPSPIIWFVGIAATISYAAFNAMNQQPIATIMLRALSGICVTHIFISGAKTWFNRSSRLIDQAVAASFGIYMLHYPLIAALGLALNGITGWVVAKYIGLCVVALVASYALAQAARLNQWSNLVINGAMPGAKRRAAPAGPSRAPEPVPASTFI
jgi:glucan biosynthesis protein C